jgi:hypothetical protein
VQRTLEQYTARRHQKSHRLATEAVTKLRSKLEKDFVKRQTALQKEARKGKIDKAMLQLKMAQLQGDMARSLQQQQNVLETEHMKRAARDESKIKVLEGGLQEQLREKQVAQLKELRLTQARFQSAEARLEQLGYTIPTPFGQTSAPMPTSQQCLEPPSLSAQPQVHSTDSPVPSPQMAQPVTSAQDISITQVLGGLACLTGRALDIAGSVLIQVGTGAGQQSGSAEGQNMPGSFD